jgi:hypothetical protein
LLNSFCCRLNCEISVAIGDAEVVVMIFMI